MRDSALCRKYAAECRALRDCCSNPEHAALWAELEDCWLDLAEAVQDRARAAARTGALLAIPDGLRLRGDG